MFGTNNDARITGDGNLLIQDVHGSTITINLNDDLEVRTFLINFKNEIRALPTDILTAIKDHQNLENAPVVGANLYLTMILKARLAPPHHAEAKFGLSITNLTKEIRYFSQPYFKTDPRLEMPGADNGDAFIMFEAEQKNFPIRMEYGEVVSLVYDIGPDIMPFFRNIAQEGAYMQAFISTTLGELYTSNQYEVQRLVLDFERIRAIR
ncbi:MAG: hypothetical protein BGO21_21375 [Dyadobacter sp. 50-39]|uniref:hypothetical protein n=1 Tax=Dyadobacter sp. 50-39 TaxID=1895756 RepID=UPI00096973C8|nr:hypothetical protein [Dyadobacter sp. 50-39]OJV19242.1 MAG: hypothetical protein BGO21_21375 [Dyadobacter sp. 50-39]